MKARSALLLLLPLLAAAACTDDDGDAGSPLTRQLATSSTAPAPPHEVATSRDGRADGVLDVVSGATSVTVRDAALGLDRVRASTPDGAGVAPVLDVQGDTVRVHLVSTGLAGPAAVTVLLDRQVRWQVRLSGGATTELVDLRGGRLAGVDLLAGATRIELSLPAPAGVVPVRLVGGATELIVHLPAGTASGVRVAAARRRSWWTGCAAATCPAAAR